MTLKFWRFLTTNLWPILSGAASLYFLLAVHQHVGFPPTKPLTPTAALYLGLFVLFMLAPFVHRFRLGRLIKFETKVEEVRSDMKEVGTETRETDIYRERRRYCRFCFRESKRGLELPELRMGCCQLNEGRSQLNV